MPPFIVSVKFKVSNPNLPTMSKSNFFTGQPILSQVLQLIPSSLVDRLARKHKADRYCKKFMAWDHVVAMVFSIFQQATSLREVVTGLQAWDSRLRHLGVKNFPRRSTLADANSRRPEAFFQELFQELFRSAFHDSPDSRRGSRKIEDKMFLMDSTTVELFSEIMRGVGNKPASGKRKGGVKAHVLMNATEDVPKLVSLTEARCNDKQFMNLIDLPAGSIIVFDKGYSSYKFWSEWSNRGITWVTRANSNLFYELEEDFPVSERAKKEGVIQDQKIRIGNPGNRNTWQVSARRIEFWDKKKKKLFVFITNNMKFGPQKIALIYKKRWKIELFFKRLKQNFTLKYFLGDNENAIKIQIWCTLICDLLVKLIKERLTKRKWSFSNLAGFLRIHLGTYIELRGFLDNPERALLIVKPKFVQQSLFSP